MFRKDITKNPPHGGFFVCCLLYVHFVFECKFSFLEFVHFRKTRTAGVRADTVILVRDDNDGVFACLKFAVVHSVRKHFGRVMERGEIEAVTCEFDLCSVADKREHICTDVVAAFLGHYHGVVVFICYCGIVNAVESMCFHINIAGAGTVCRISDILKFFFEFEEHTEARYLIHIVIRVLNAVDLCLDVAAVYCELHIDIEEWSS